MTCQLRTKSQSEPRGGPQLLLRIAIGRVPLSVRTESAVKEMAPGVRVTGYGPMAACCANIVEGTTPCTGKGQS